MIPFPQPNVHALWEALTSGLVIHATDATECHIDGRGGHFSSLFHVDEDVRKNGVTLVAKTLWYNNHAWNTVSRAWAVDEVQRLDVDELRRPAHQVFTHGIAPRHRDDHLLAYAWWGNVPEVFDALIDKGLNVNDALWAGESLNAWIERAREHPEAAQYQWAWERRVIEEQQVLRSELKPWDALPERERRRL